MNRLLTNMENKINVIDDAIDQCRRLKRDETIPQKQKNTYAAAICFNSEDIEDLEKSLNTLKS